MRVSTNAFLPDLNLLAHQFKVARDVLHADPKCSDQRKRLRVLGQHCREHAGNNVSRFGSGGY